MKYIYFLILFFLLLIISGSCTSFPSQPDQIAVNSNLPLEEPGCVFVDSSQRLGEGRSRDVSLGDVDEDGDLDAVVANGVRGGIGSEVWMNDGNGNFILEDQALGFGNGLDLGDLDKDGDLDIFIVGWEEHGRIWWNDGYGRFADSGQILGEAGGWDVGIGDLDNDGDLDGVIAHEQENTIWLNDGSGRFEDSGQRLGSAYSAAAGLADLDKDGDLDLVTAGWDEPGSVWLNDGKGVFTDSGQELSRSSIHMHGLSVGDLTGDGAVDIVLTGAPSQLWLNDGLAGFEQSDLGIYIRPGDTAALGDIDQDGDVDIYMAVGVAGQAEDKILLNDSAGGFVACEQELSDLFSSGVGLGDLDGDGDLDVFVAHGQLGLSSGGGLPNEVWMNETP